MSRNTVAKYADMEDMSPTPPLPAERRRPAPDGHEARVESVLEADLSAPRKQRHTARRVFDVLARRIAAGAAAAGGCDLSVYDALVKEVGDGC